MSAESKKSEEVVRQYASGLSEMDLTKIAFILDKDFKFTYRLDNGSGHGITTDVRYIGHLYKSFCEMKKAGVIEIKTGFCELEVDGVKFLSIKIMPPHERPILYPMDWQIIESYRAKLHVMGIAILLPKVKHEKLCKIECFASVQQFFDYRGGRVLHENVD